MVKHNKRKNARIIYEQLLVLATRLALTEQKDEFDFVTEIINKHFGLKSLIAQEKKIFDSIINSQNKSSADADAILNECTNEYSSINTKKLQLEKDVLFKTVLESLGKDFFRIPLKEYKLYASIQILLNESVSIKKLSSPAERIKIKKFLCEHMTNTTSNEDNIIIDNITYKMLINKFGKRYYSLITEQQKNILNKYIHYLIDNDDNTFKEFLQKQKDDILISMSPFVSNESTKEDGMQLNEAYKQLITENYEKITEEKVYILMRYCDLLEDCKQTDE